MFFASDNTDFAEDTADGKGTTHGTVTAIYQKADAPGEPITPPLRICDTKSKSLLVTPYHTAMLPCEKPKATASQKRARECSINNSGVADSYQLTQLGWVVASTLSMMKNERSSQIPGWAGYMQILAVNKQAADRGWCPAPTPRSGTRVVNSVNSYEAGTSVKGVDSWSRVHHCHNLWPSTRKQFSWLMLLHCLYEVVV